MNNTKWREVWTVLCELRLRIHFAYADAEDWNRANSRRLWGPFPISYVRTDGIRDPGIGGPFRYNQILWIRVPRIAGNDTDAFIARLESLGQLSLAVDPEHVEVRGYDEAGRA